MSSQNDEVTCDVGREQPAKAKKADDVNRTGRHAQERREEERAAPLSVSFVSHILSSVCLSSRQLNRRCCR
jgi:hypothetical protein